MRKIRTLLPVPAGATRHYAAIKPPEKPPEPSPAASKERRKSSLKLPPQAAKPNGNGLPSWSQTTSKANTEAAVRRRAALRALMSEHGLNIGQTAEAVNCAASTIGNFMNGRTAALSLEIAEHLARLFKVGLNELVGDGDWITVPGHRVHLQGEIATGRWVRDYHWDREKWVGYAVPLDQRYAEKSRLFLLQTLEMNELWPQGTVLQVVSLADFEEDLRHGNRVIIASRNPQGFVEAGVREIFATDHRDSACTLMTRSTDPAFRGLSIQMSWPIKAHNSLVLPNGNQVEVVYVVIRSIRQEL